MRKKSEDSSSVPGGHAAERLREFLRERLPPGASPDELNPDLAKNKPDLAKNKKDKDRGPGEQQGNAD